MGSWEKIGKLSSITEKHFSQEESASSQFCRNYDKIKRKLPSKGFVGTTTFFRESAGAPP
ncbi:hypothetical protein A0128_11975 [Leptospira tipperaryensis]|uniref:Uncharacterized protein n=1 Tax=Leptospira tipperaryensis TaxID=2564040 RepID=A0A1D7UY45_9LEPT|nr:hypothetical protein A0128_11975 [Leptospira tipperaryensis]